MGRIKIGNSGWSYKDWVGTFYPKGSRPSRYLAEYFQHFETVEVNSTFYNLPKRSAVQGWAKEAMRWKGRELCIKVPQRISHDLCMEEGPESMVKAYEEFSATVLTPLEEAGVLGAVLFQASPYFTFRGDIKYRMKSEPKVPLPGYIMGRTRLSEISSMMSDHPGDPAVELRNSSWLDENSHLLSEAEEVLRQNGTALVAVDGPSFPWIDADTSRYNYIRFHGRNKEEWYRETDGDPSARYRYLYPEEELKERRDPILIMASKVDKDTRVFFNNHPQGYAPQNAARMMEILGVERPAGAIDRFW